MYWYIYLGYYILSREINTNGQLIIITCQYIYKSIKFDSTKKVK